MRLIDSHCHLHDTEFYPDNQEEIYQRTVGSGIAMICVGTDERSSHQAVEFASSHDLVWATVGVHPHDSKMGWNDISGILERHAKSENSPIVGIGEIGLDYYYNYSPRDKQIEALEAQIQLAVDYNLPISFHVRDGFDDFWPIFDNFHGVRGVLHSFTDVQDNLDKGYERGLYVGINGISTFTKDPSQQELYAHIPLSKLLLETDAPFLTPVPKRGKVNEPGYVELVADFWAEKRDLPKQSIIDAATKNTRELFGI